MTQELQWAIGIALTATAGLVGAVGLLLRVSYRLGSIVQDFHKIAEDLKNIKLNADKVPVLENDLKATKELYGAIHSDIRHLMRRSQGDFGAEE